MFRVPGFGIRRSGFEPPVADADEDDRAQYHQRRHHYPRLIDDVGVSRDLPAVGCLLSPLCALASPASLASIAVLRCRDEWRLAADNAEGVVEKVLLVLGLVARQPPLPSSSACRLLCEVRGLALNPKLVWVSRSFCWGGASRAVARASQLDCLAFGVWGLARVGHLTPSLSGSDPPVW